MRNKTAGRRNFAARQTMVRGFDSPMNPLFLHHDYGGIRS